MTQVIIRADGNNQIGFGHIVRTQALAAQLQALGAKVTIVTRNPENIVLFETALIPADMTLKKEFEYWVNISQEMAAKIIIVDSYAVDQVTLDKVGAIGACSVYIDDLNRFDFNVDFVINGNLYASHLNYQGKARFLLGPDFLLMREEFQNVPCHFNKNPKNIMISLGAADPECVTFRVIEIIKKYKRFKELNWHIVIGPANIHTNKIVRAAKPYNNMRLYNNPNMRSVMENCDICISAGGSTVYELAACGVPSLLIITADNQIMLAKEAHHYGFAINLGWYETLPDRALYDNLEWLLYNREEREHMVQIGRRLVDGCGARRTAEILIAGLQKYI